MNGVEAAAAVIVRLCDDAERSTKKDSFTVKEQNNCNNFCVSLKIYKRKSEIEGRWRRRSIKRRGRKE
jgi:hypothetical protein